MYKLQKKAKKSWVWMEL